MVIRCADRADLQKLSRLDRHIRPNDLAAAISSQRVLIAQCNGQLVGWLRWNLFWDNTPFMNMLYVCEPHRGTGIGKALVLEWEKLMAMLDFQTLMTSTASNEYAQHFYEKLDYQAIGGFTLPGEPYELILTKNLRRTYFHHKEEF